MNYPYNFLLVVSIALNIYLGLIIFLECHKEHSGRRSGEERRKNAAPTRGKGPHEGIKS